VVEEEFVAVLRYPAEGRIEPAEVVGSMVKEMRLSLCACRWGDGVLFREPS